MKLKIIHRREGQVIFDGVKDVRGYLVDESELHDDQFIALDEFGNTVKWHLKHFDDRTQISGEIYESGKPTQYIDLFAALEKKKMLCYYNPISDRTGQFVVFRFYFNDVKTVRYGRIEGKALDGKYMLRVREPFPFQWLIVDERLIPQ